MATVIILPDIHLKLTQVDTILSWEEPYDRVVCTGDVFDSRGNTGFTTNLAGARWLKAKLADPRWVMTVGNHDFATIRWPNNPWVYSNDWASLTDRELATRMLTEEDWSKVKPYHVEAGVLFTHAGLDMGLIPLIGDPLPDDLTLPAITAWIDTHWPRAVQAYREGRSHPLMDAGSERGGPSQVGGICWRDFGWHNPIPALGQVVGHSVQDEGPLMRIINRNGAPMWRFLGRKPQPVKTEWLKEGWTLDLDTKMRSYAVLDTVARTLTVKAVTWMRQSREMDTYLITPGGVVTTIQLPAL